MKVILLWLSVLEVLLSSSVIAQSASSSSVGLLDVITQAESGLGALTSANAAQSSGVPLGGFVSIAESGLSALTSAESSQSSRASKATAATSASRSSASASNPTSSSSLSQAKPTSASSTTSAPASSSSAASSGSWASRHRTLIIVLAVVLGLLAFGIFVIALACCLTRRHRHHKRISRRTLTPESEIDSWRGQSAPEMAYAQLPNEAHGAHVDNGRPSSHPYPVLAPDPRLHPAMREDEVQHAQGHENPFVPVVPPPRRKGAPNSRPGLTDATVPGDDPYIGAAVLRPRSRSMSSSRMRRGHVDSTYSSLEPDRTSASPPNSGLNNHPTSIITSDLPPSYDNKPYRDSRPATPMALTGFGASVASRGAINPDSSHVAPRAEREYAPYHDYDFVPPHSPSRSPFRRGTPPHVPSRSPKRVSFSPESGSGSHSNSQSNSDTGSTESSSAWRMSQMPGSFDTPQSPPTPTRRSMTGYFPGEQTRHEPGSSRNSSTDRNSNANPTLNLARRMRLSDLRPDEREWYQHNHDQGYGVGTAL